MNLSKKREFQSFRLTVNVVVALMLLSMPTYAQREIQSLNDRWRFMKGDFPAAESTTFDDSKWENINLPHTWNTDAYIVKDYYQGKG